MTQHDLYYLGPEGSFTHQAAQEARSTLAGPAARMPLDSLSLHAAADVPHILKAVEQQGAWGVSAWENNIEGYVVPNLDALIDASDVVGFTRVGVDIAFDAFVRDDPDSVKVREVVAHPHGLAQCSRFTSKRHLTPVPATSNAAACRDLCPGQVALGPSLCGSLYGLRTLSTDVQDYRGARTDFLVIGPRNDWRRLVGGSDVGSDDFETVITFIPLQTGPGILADLLDVLRDAGLNMTSFISRPIKAHDGTYSFIATIDAAPWEPHFTKALRRVLAQGGWVKTLAVYPRRERRNPPVDAWMLPHGGVRARGTLLAGADGNVELARQIELERRELLW